MADGSVPPPSPPSRPVWGRVGGWSLPARRAAPASAPGGRVGARDSRPRPRGLQPGAWRTRGRSPSQSCSTLHQTPLLRWSDLEQ